jgi:hypothetical protein
VIGMIDLVFTTILVVLVIRLVNVTNAQSLGKPFSSFLLAIPITSLVVVFLPRVIGFVVAYLKKKELTARKIQSTIRSITSVLMFGLSMSMLIILVVLFKGNSNLLKMTDVDITFIRSD